MPVCTVHIYIYVNVEVRGVVPQKQPALLHEIQSLCGTWSSQIRLGWLTRESIGSLYIMCVDLTYMGSIICSMTYILIISKSYFFSQRSEYFLILSHSTSILTQQTWVMAELTCWDTCLFIEQFSCLKSNTVKIILSYIWSIFLSKSGPSNTQKCRLPVLWFSLPPPPPSSSFFLQFLDFLCHVKQQNVGYLGIREIILVFTDCLWSLCTLFLGKTSKNDSTCPWTTFQR